MLPSFITHASAPSERQGLWEDLGPAVLPGKQRALLQVLRRLSQCSACDLCLPLVSQVSSKILKGHGMIPSCSSLLLLLPSLVH